MRMDGSHLSLVNRPGVYLITNLASGMVYVGSSVGVKERIKRHVYDLNAGTHANQHLQRAWTKHGAAGFDVDAIEYLVGVENLIEREQFHMDARKAADRRHGYNIIPRADRKIMSEETKMKIAAAGRIAQLGKIVSPETRAKIAAALTGRKLSPETIEKRSAKRRGVPLTAEHRAAVAAAITGSRPSAEARANMSAAQLGRKRSEESCRKASETMKRLRASQTPEQRGVGRKASAVTIEKRRASLRAAWARRKATNQIGNHA